MTGSNSKIKIAEHFVDNGSEYAQRIVSSEGKHDGLYWPASQQAASPLADPQRVELEHQDGDKNGALLDNLETLRSQKAKLEHAIERLIDSFAGGLIEKDQFASRMARTKSRITDLDSRINTYAGSLNRRDHLRLAANRLRELATTVGPGLASADWQRR